MDNTNIDEYEKIFGDKKRIMVVLAHPDDLELYCGGTVARLIKDGKRVRSVKVTSGDMGSRQEKTTEAELKNTRELEDSESMRKLGIKDEDNIYLQIIDGTVENNLTVIGKIAQQIRIFKPDLIITHNPEDVIIVHNKNESWVNHRDHRNTGLSAIDASYPYSRDLLFFPEHFKNPEAGSHGVTEYLLVDFYSGPNLVHIDVTETVDMRVKAHACHKSQYSIEDAQESADFFTTSPDYPEGKRFERFRYVKTD